MSLSGASGVEKLSQAIDQISGGTPSGVSTAVEGTRKGGVPAHEVKHQSRLKLRPLSKPKWKRIIKKIKELNWLSKLRSSIWARLHRRNDSIRDHPVIAIQEDEGDAVRQDRLDVGDLDQAIAKLEETVNLTPHDDPNRSSLLSDLAENFQTRFTELGEVHDIEQAISKQKEALQLTPRNHPDRHSRLESLGHSFTSRFYSLYDIRDIEQAVDVYNEAEHLIPHDHPERPGYLQFISLCLGTRFQRLGDVRDLDQAILKQEEAVQLTPRDHPERSGRLDNLAAVFQVRFECSGDIRDVEEALARQQEAVELTPDDDPDLASRVDSLGNLFGTRFRLLGDVRDIEQAILRMEEAIRLTPHDHPTITTKREAVQLTPRDHPHRARRLDGLGISLAAHFHHTGTLCYVEQALTLQEEAVQLTPADNPERPTLLENLGTSFYARFQRFGEVRDIDQAIAKGQEALQLTTYNDARRPFRLANLGKILHTRFDHFGDIHDIEQAILKAEEAINLTPDDHADRAGRLESFGNCLASRFQSLGNIHDIEKAITIHEEALHLTPRDHPNHSRHLVSLGMSLHARFDRLGNIRDIEQAILRKQEAVNLTPHDHPDRPRRLETLGSSLSSRFGRLGDVRDIDQALAAQEQAVLLTPHDHPWRALCLCNLGISFYDRFHSLDDVSDIEQAIVMMQEAVKLIPPEHRDRARCLECLGGAFWTRFHRLDSDDIRDLEQAITMQEEALHLTHRDSSERPGRLNTIAISLHTRFDLRGDVHDIDRAIAMKQEAVQLTPHDHHQRSDFLDSLGISFRARYTKLGDQSALESALLNFSSAARSTTASSSTRFAASEHWIWCAETLKHASLLDAYALSIQLLPQLAWIGLPLENRYQQLLRGAGVVREAARAALEHFRPETAVEWLEQGRSVVWNDLLQLRAPLDELYAEHPKLAEKLEQVSNKLERASASASGRNEHDSKYGSLGTKTTGIDGIHWQPSLEEQAREHRALALERERILAEVRALPGFERFLTGKTIEEITASMRCGVPGPVVILNASKKGCDALIVHCGRNDSDSDRVRHVPFPDFRFAHAKALQGILEKLVRYGGRNLSKPGSPIPSESSDVPFDLGGDLEEALDPLPNLRDIGHDATSLSNRAARPARSFTPDQSFELVLSILWTYIVKPVLTALGITTPVPSDLQRIFWCPTGPFAFLPIHAAGLYDAGSGTIELGSKLSNFAISSYTPTLSALSALTAVSQTRTDTGTSTRSSAGTHVRLLVVGQPDSDGQMPLPGTREEMHHIKALLTGTDTADPSNHTPNPNARSPNVTLIESDGTIEDVLDKMKESDWVHFACHGVQDLERPIESGLLLARGRRLKLSDVIKLRLSSSESESEPDPESKSKSESASKSESKSKSESAPRPPRRPHPQAPNAPQAGLAFLSACETATGDKALSDEAVHLAAGMLSAGYSSVIATMWRIGDADAVEVARDVYGELFRVGGVGDGDGDGGGATGGKLLRVGDWGTGGELLSVGDEGGCHGAEGMPDWRKSARALSGAVERLRARGASYFAWVPYIHVGL